MRRIDSYHDHIRVGNVVSRLLVKLRRRATEGACRVDADRIRQFGCCIFYLVLI